MKAYTVHPHMTPKRLEYLRAVEAGAPYEPRHGVTANQCIQLGWVETMIRTKDGRLIAWDELPPGPERWETLSGSEIVGQRLTDKGRALLEREDT